MPVFSVTSEPEALGPQPEHPPLWPWGHPQCVPNVKWANNAQISIDGREG